MKGTLTIGRRHLIFTHAIEGEHGNATPSTARDGTPIAPRATPTVSAQSSTVGDAASTKSKETTGSLEGEGRKSVDRRQKPRNKEIWIGLPMINRCVLRPSHLQGLSGKPQTHSSDVSADGDSDDAFPPSFGTSSYTRPSTDSAQLAPYSSPRRPASPANEDGSHDIADESGRSPAIRIRCRDFQMVALHFHGASSDSKSPDDMARQVFFALRSRSCVDRLEDFLAFHYHPIPPERSVEIPVYDARREFARMGIGGKAAEGPGSAWRLSDMNHDYSFSTTYPSLLCVPRAVSDNLLKYGGAFRSRSRIPSLAYLHFNGGSITRSSQPMVGVQGKRNPQDERLVSAIFSSHTPPLTTPETSPNLLTPLKSPSTTTLESSASDSATVESEVPSLHLSQSETALDEKAGENVTPVKRKVYGSTRRNLIVDARPKLNALANRATGGGIEDISNYTGTGDIPVEKVFLNIQNIHVMRSSLEKVVDSFGNADYVSLPPDQELLRKSGWLGHIAALIEGSELVARAVGLAGSHALIHCSDGWDRTSQVSALAQVMLDPHYRTLNGFITLIQKDFLSFGHKFRDRNGIQGSEKWFEIENERIAPSRSRDNTGSDSTNLNVLGSKALSGARSWFEKNRSNLFRQQNAAHDSSSDTGSRPASPPPNPLIHSPPAASGKEEKEHRVSEKEIAPIFHQYLDAVYQLLRQHPAAFEFNERFLLRLLYQVYACQYGEFLFNNEKERSQHAGKVPSVWMYFLARRADFINPDYNITSADSLLLPKRVANQQVDAQWWYNLFGRKDEEMNVPRALAPADPPSFNAQPSSLSLDDRAVSGAEKTETGGSSDAALRSARSSPSLSRVRDGLTTGLSALSMQSTPSQSTPVPSTDTARPPLQARETDFEILSKYAGGSLPPTAPNAGSERREQQQQDPPNQGEGDPLGVTNNTQADGGSSSRLDFAAFASQNAFRDR